MPRQPKQTWFVAHRMAWIAEMLDIYGFINREHLTKKFGISAVHAAGDFSRFQAAFPDRMTYNTSTKRYEKIDHGKTQKGNEDASA